MKTTFENFPLFKIKMEIKKISESILPLKIPTVRKIGEMLITEAATSKRAL